MAPFYSLIFASMLVAAFEFFTGRKQQILFFISILVLIVFAGTRAVGVDPDSENYQRLFEDYSDISAITSSAAGYLYEPVSKLIFFLVNLSGFGVEVVFLIFACLTLLAKEALIRRVSPYPMLSVYLLCCHFYLYYEMVQIRAALAMSLVVIGCINYDRRKSLGTLTVLLAACVHISALLGLAFILMKEFQVDLRRYLKLLIFSLFIALIFVAKNDIFFSTLALFPIEKVDSYLDIINNYQAASIYGVTLAHLLPILIGYWLIDKKVITNSIHVDLIRFYSLCIPYYWIFLPISVMAYRSSEFFQIVNIVLLPILINKMPIKSLGLLLLFIVGLAISYFTLFIRELFPFGYSSWLLP